MSSPPRFLRPPGARSAGDLGRNVVGWALAPVLAAAVALSVAPSARAELYSVPIIVESEDDIFDLYDNGDILEHEMDVLMELFQRGVDINRASRDELFELPGMTYPMADAVIRVRNELGRVEDLEQLYEREAITYDVLQQISAFVTFGRPPISLKAPVSGSLRLKVLETFDDEQLPASNARARLSALEGRLDVGWVGTLRERPGHLFLSNEGAEPYFIADEPRLRFEGLEKAYVSYRTDVGASGRAQIIVGSFNAGFGERLTLDTTNRRRPYGLYVDDLIFDNVGGESNYSADFRSHKGLRGASVGVQGIELGDTLRLDVTALGSWNPVDEYQYRYVPNRTYFSEEAAAGGETGCTSEGRCHAYQTFRDVYRHRLAGGNARMWLNGRSYVGLTGYVADNVFLAGDDVVDFAASSRQPIRRAFGTVGLEGGVGVGILDVFGEFARTDSGGNGALLRTLWDIDRVALEITGRYYDARFDNPFGRGEASAGQFLGMRSRDEAGGKVRAVIQPDRKWRIVTHADAWRHMAQERTDVDLYLRNELDPTRQVRWAVWTRMVDKDLGLGGRDQDYERSPSVNYDAIYDEVDPDEAAIELRSAATDLARGMRAEVGNQLTLKPSRFTTVAAYARVTWRDVSVYDEYFERGLSMWLRGAVKPVTWLDLSSRVRYFDDDLDASPEDTSGDGFLDYQRGNQFIEVYGRVAISVPKKLRASLRYDIRSFTDVKVRDRDPQHLIRGMIDAQF